MANRMTDEHVSIFAKISEWFSYFICCNLVAGSIMDYLNHYAAAFGIFLGLCTFIVNWYYKHKEFERYKLHYVYSVKKDVD